MVPSKGRAPMRVRVFPSDDEELAQTVEAVLGRFGLGSDASEDGSLDVIGDELRKRYPRLVIELQSDLGSLGDEPLRWYVYRDGQAVEASAG